MRYAGAALAVGILALGMVRADESKPEKSFDTKALVRQLTEGDHAERLAGLKQVGPYLDRHPDVLLPAMMECARESSPPLRAAAINIIGQQMIWVEGPQNRAAIEFALEMSRDADPEVRHSCVYFCLSTVRDKSQRIVDRLIELACESESAYRREFVRVAWCLRAQQEFAAKRIEAYLDRQDDRAELSPVVAGELYRQLTGRIPARFERFAQQGEFFVLVNLALPLHPKTPDDVVRIMRKEIGGEASAMDIRGAVSVKDGDAGALIRVRGLGPWARLAAVIDSTAGLELVEVAIITPTLRPEVEALLRRPL
jgi:hypothetical protein